ncbi:phosphoenolpyruvate--protein phosphotransferase [bacterium]|nr:MAG: phosphoenolpyruvate--protein phosphotransferase [bacterium]
MLFSKRKVKGYATDTGGTTSHTAIISRALRVPAVVGMKTISKNVSTGDFVIINGFDGEVIINPQEKTISRYRLKREEFIHHESRLIETINLPCETLDKKSVEISANIEFIEEVEFLVNCGHCGIGLYRTEHLFMSKGDYPSEAEQIEEYMHIANVTFPKNVTLRTFDLGGDKVLPTSVKEINPNLGWRGIRISLDRTDIFKIQLRAMLLSSVKKNIKVMFPMISSLDEVRKAKEILNEVKTELNNQGAVFDNDIKTGIMVEIPSAFVLADDLAKEVGFFSVGTNDLTQYMLAVDRGNELISGMYQQLHPAIIRALKAIVSSAHSNNITVSICGEMASIPIAVPLLVGLGFDELSVNPGIFPEIKQIVRNINYADSKKLSEQVQTISTESELIKVLDKFLSEKVKDKLI